MGITRLLSNTRLKKHYVEFWHRPTRHHNLSTTSATTDNNKFNQPSWSNATLPGGFTKEGLRQWAILSDFGAEGYDKLNSREIRQRQRHYLSLEDNPRMLPYVDLFSKRVSNDCSEYLVHHPSPSDILGRAFFGSDNFTGERVIISSLNEIFSIYPDNTKKDRSGKASLSTLPKNFDLNDTYLHWKVTMKAPLELICSWKVERADVKGCTMLAFDPSLRYAYHGNCINVTEERVQKGFAQMGIQMHVKYAHFLLDGMVNELENIVQASGL